jgi:hypothetical protein
MNVSLIRIKWSEKLNPTLLFAKIGNNGHFDQLTLISFDGPINHDKP